MVLNKSFKVLRRWRPSRSVLLESRSIPEASLLFESGTVNVLTPAEADYIRKDYPDVESAYGCLGVLQGEGFLYLVLITGCVQTGKIGNTEVYCITKTSLIPLHSNSYQHDGVVEMGKLLTCGQFYFSNGEKQEGFSLMSRAQKQGQDDPQFLWNRSLYVYLQRFNIDCSKWLIPLMCGSVQIQTVYAGNKQVKACLVSRMSCERTGTRFNVRGLDDDGQVANFVETEQVMFVDDFIVSFVQVRGLVPIFWDQPGIQTGTNRIRLSRGFHSSHPAFERHYERLLKEYGPSLSLDLLGNRDMEPLLTEAFKEHIAELAVSGATQYLNFDYHLHCKPGHVEALESILLPQCVDFLEGCGFYLEKGGTVVNGQTGVLRHNCLDCLDRSNNAQTLMGIAVLKKQLETIGVVLKGAVLARFVEQYKSLWVQNGDNISKFYAGTRALDGKTKVGKLRDGARSVQRTIKNNFLDSSKQEAIDILLLNSYVGELGWKTRALLSPADALAPLPIRRGLSNRWQEFTRKEKLRVCIGTWNVNGGKHIRSVALKNQSLHDWLLDSPQQSQVAADHPEDFQSPADIYALGFQELVGLTAANLVSTSSSNRHEWAAELQRVLSRDTPYSLLTAEQLVGVCLYIFVRPPLVPFIRDVAVSSVKTGIGGTAGNKGGVAIRLLLHSTSICFVCSHFAAHQSKVMERNNDFAEICRKVQFPLGQSINSHDYVFWCGDLNYRIDLPGHLAKDMIAKSEFEKLHRHEQLIKQRKLGKVFQGYCEGVLNFAPTFKYDVFSDDYDTSEKARVPAWCDRVLWKRNSFLPPLKLGMARLRDDTDPNDTSNGEYGWYPSSVPRVYERELASGDPALDWWHPGRLLYYGRTELKTSDHRPILALLEVDTFRVNDTDRRKTLQEVLRELGPPDATVIVTADDEDSNCIDNAKLVPTLQQYGRVVLVRSTDVCTLVTFENPESAIEAVNHSGKKIDNVAITVKLKQPEYCFDKSNVSILTRAHLAKLSYLEEEEEQEDRGGLRERNVSHLGLEMNHSSEGEYSQDDEDENIAAVEENQPLEQLTEQEQPTVVVTPAPKPNRPPPPVSRVPLPTSRLEPSEALDRESSQEEGGGSSSPEDMSREESDSDQLKNERPCVPPRPPSMSNLRNTPQQPPQQLQELLQTNNISSSTSGGGNGDDNSSSSSPETLHLSATDPNDPPPKPKPTRTPPTRPRPPPMNAKQRSAKDLQHPTKPSLPKYSPQRPAGRPTKPAAPKRPAPPKRPPPPYVKLYPDNAKKELAQSLEPPAVDPNFSDSSIEPEPQFSDSSLEQDD